jgi:hypothetical protein
MKKKGYQYPKEDKTGSGFSVYFLSFMVEEDFKDVLGGFGKFDFFAERGFGHESAEAGEGLDVRPGLIETGAEEHDEVDGLAIEAVEFHGFGGFSDGDNQRIQAVALAVRDSEALSDAGGTGGFADEDGLEESGFFGYFSRLMQQIHQFFNRGVFIGCLQRHFYRFQRNYF